MNPALNEILESQNGRVIHVASGKEEVLRALIVDEIGKHAIKDVNGDILGCSEIPIMLIDTQNLVSQYNRWVANLPRIQPHYAIKCNPNLIILRTLAALGCGFDSASPAEMSLVLDQLNLRPSSIVFSNPCKQNYSLEFMHSRDVQMTVFDSGDELVKISNYAPHSKLLMRIRCDDSLARCPMSCKFGCGPEDWHRLLSQARSLNLELVGVHFHVGSGCMADDAYVKPISDARKIFDLGPKYGHNGMRILNIGGGYPGLGEPDIHAQEDVSFEAMSSSINEALDKFFFHPGDGGYISANQNGVWVDTETNDEERETAKNKRVLRVLSEPGRYFAAGAASHAVVVLSKHEISPDSEDPARAESVDDAETTDNDCDNENGICPREFEYVVSDSVYGNFNCILYDHAHVTPHILIRNTELIKWLKSENERPKLFEKDSDEKLFKTKLCGQSREKVDCIVEDHMMPELYPGDWLYFCNAGAYTSAAVTSLGGYVNQAKMLITRIIVENKPC